MLEFPGSPPRRRFTVKGLENLLLAIAVIAAAAVGIHALTSGSSPGEPQPAAVSRSLSATPAGQADTSALVSKAPASADKEGEELRAQLAQATEQLKTSQGRISELEGALKQAPSAADLDKAGKQGEALRGQLAQATEQLKASQGRISELEGQLKQAPSAADLDKARQRARAMPGDHGAGTEPRTAAAGLVR